MLLREFPNLIWLKQKINQRFDDRIGWNGRTLESTGWPTVLLNVRAKETVRDQIKGPLSIFTNLKGSAFVTAANTRVKVTEDVFFISNSDQYYTLEIKEPVETFNVHIGEKLAEEVLYSQSHNNAYLIDNPEMPSSQSPSFYNKLYWKDEYFKNVIKKLSSTTSKLAEHELLGSLVNYLIVQTHQLKTKERSLSALKASTRGEISKRLFMACDFIYSHYQTEINLEELARVSCLSKFHFLRLFKDTFQETPHQFITRLRIEKAKDYLREKSWSVKDIACKVGFPDASSFSRSFKNNVGLYPLHFVESPIR